MYLYFYFCLLMLHVSDIQFFREYVSLLYHILLCRTPLLSTLTVLNPLDWKVMALCLSKV